MDVPVTGYSGDMKIKGSFRGRLKRQTVSAWLSTGGRKKMVMDEDYDIARQFSRQKKSRLLLQGLSAMKNFDSIAGF